MSFEGEDWPELSQMVASTKFPQVDMNRHLPWLARSYEDGASFWQWLKDSLASSFEGYSKSAQFIRYSFFNDMIARNASNPAPAFVWYDSELQQRSLSYKALANAASLRAQAWKRSGLTKAHSLCIIEPVGVDLVISIAAALKLGVVYCWVPPHGKWLVGKRLANVKADFVDAGSLYHELVDAEIYEILPRAVASKQVVLDANVATDYLSESPLSMGFDGTNGEYRDASPLLSDQAYLASLRDGIITLGLRRGASYSAIGFNDEALFPSFFFAGWMVGATYVHLPLADVEQTPSLLTQQSLSILGVSETARQMLTAKEVPLGGVTHHVFRDPADGVDLVPWQLFLRICGLSDAWVSNVRWNSALGGSTLFSPRLRGLAHMEVWPSAGQPYSLGDLFFDEVSSGTMGLLTLEPIADLETKPKLTRNRLSVSRGRYLYIGIDCVGRGALAMPMRDYNEVIEPLPGCYGIAPVLTTGVRDDGGSSVDLLVFHDSSAVPRSIKQLIETRITKDLHDDFQLDRVIFYPLFPRLSEDGLEYVWCKNQHTLGLLKRRMSDPLCTLVNEMRVIAHFRKNVIISDI